jgi:hypothetical protein
MAEAGATRSDGGEAAFAELEHQLFAATVVLKTHEEQLKNGEAQPSLSPGEARPEVFAVHVALDAVIAFINRVPEWRAAELALAFELLLHATIDLEGGKEVDWLRPRRGANDGRPGVSFDQANRRGQVVWVIDYVIGRGSRPGAAAKVVFDACPSGFIEKLLDDKARTHAPDVSPGTLRRWRDELNAPRAKRKDYYGAMRAGYVWRQNFMATEGHQINDWKPDAAAKLLISAIAEGLSL